MKYKKAELSIAQLISLILVLVVIAVVIITILNPRVWDWARSLPDYNYDNSDKEINTADTLGADTTIQTQYFKVAKVLNGKEINFCLDEICSKVEKSKLYIAGDSVNSKIRVVQWDWNDAIGEIVNNKLKIYDEILDKRGSLYDEVKKDLPLDSNFLIKLNGGIFNSGIIYRDKKIENEK